ncbi:MAG: ABC transporter permease subunit [Bdellovibrionaceae bacterium]|jgi:ABC-2 type transport system permease protein|nr:ABC transporter permease subunit [Pseudobdellovibrionaceae bacterium]
MISHSVKVIFKKELKNYFSSPLGYVFLTIFIFAIGYVTFEPGRGSFFQMRQSDLSAFFKYVPWLFIILVPAVSMKLWAEEKKSGTIELLLTLPVTVTEAVLGKFLAAWAFLAIALICTFPLVLTVAYLGNPDLGVIFIGYIASFLLAGSFLAIGNFFSALTKNQVVSFILSVVFCYLFFMAGSPPTLEFLSSFSPKYVVNLFESLSVLDHFSSMSAGLIALGDLWFYAVLITGWVFGSIVLLTDKKQA